MRENGYPFELHYVTTKDGYVLALHRMPPRDSTKAARRPVLIMHGLLGSSADWLVTGPNRSIGIKFIIRTCLNLDFSYNERLILILERKSLFIIVSFPFA